MLPLLADETGFLSEHFWSSFATSLLFGLLGIALMVLGVKVFDWLSPKIDVEKELAENKNMAVAVVCAAIILGISYLVAVVVH